jgi:hypothetical protein
MAIQPFARVLEVGVDVTLGVTSIRLLVAESHVRIIHEDGQLLCELRLDPDRVYFGMDRPVHNVLRQVSVMS